MIIKRDMEIQGLSGIELIEYLSLRFGPSGCEDSVRDAVIESIIGLCDKVVTDRMDNLICRLSFNSSKPSAKGERKKIMLSAHLDEVGFMIEEIKSDGMLTFGCVGGIDPSVLAGKRVLVEGHGGIINGVICSKAIHHKGKNERKSATDSEKLYIDIGASSKESATELTFVGALATFEGYFFKMGADERTLCAKALDDRMGCAAMIEVMHTLVSSPIEQNADVAFCFTVREEIGLSGAKAAAYRLRPDYAIVLETTAVADLADVAPKERVADVGDGVVVSVMDRSTIYPKELVTLALDVAKRQNIKAQVKRYVSGGNDAGNIHKTAEGIKTVALSVPTRYLHSPACVASMEDYNSQKQLCLALIRALADKEEI